jgi:hypothetical protein
MQFFDGEPNGILFRLMRWAVLYRFGSLGVLNDEERWLRVLFVEL